MNDNVTHVYEVYIRTTPERLWEAITSSDFTKEYFFGATVDSDWSPGAALNYALTDGRQPFFATIEAIEPPCRLVHSFRSNPELDGSADPPSRVTYEIERLGSTCLLRLTHEHFAGESVVTKGTHEGWQIIFSGLKTLLETGDPLKIEWPEEAAAT